MELFNVDERLITSSNSKVGWAHLPIVAQQMCRIFLKAHVRICSVTSHFVIPDTKWDVTGHSEFTQQWGKISKDFAD